MQELPKLRFVLPPILALAFLSACAGSSDIDAKKQDKELATETAKGFAAVDDAKCQSYGFRVGTTAYSDCRKQFESEHKQSESE